MHAPIRRSVLAVAAGALVLAACGSSGTTGTGSRSATPSAGITYADCMRTHGVPNFPDPTSAAGGVQLVGSGVNTQSPAFRSAQSTCQKLLPGGIGGPGGISAARIERGVKLADCMRAHGLRTFPDPTRTPPSTLPAQNAVILGGRDGAFVLTASMVQSPAFKQAAGACGFPTFGHGFTMPVAAPGG